MYLGLICFLFLLAIFDLWVGVSNDAVNFLNSAIGARVARFRTILIVASVGVFVGATLSNGMMDIARHGIFQPAMFSFYELLCIFLAVMVTDVVLLDVFNSLGMPTSTTVSMVFELLGGTFILALIKMTGDPSLTFGGLLNTEKALSVILGIFLSVAIAFVTGSVVQWVSRLILSFNYRPNLKWSIGLFGGLAFTTIAYFIVFKGLKGSPVVSEGMSAWIDAHMRWLIIGLFVASTVVMQLLHACRVNVFRLIIFLGTFALAMAFASNDLVNFVGVPLAALSSYQEFAALPGADASSFMMGALEESARTPFLFLLGAGIIMVVALATSRKAQRVVKTSVDLSRQDEGEEMFGSSRMARSLVRGALTVGRVGGRLVPARVARFVDSRFQKEEAILAPGAAFDLVRAAVNLVLAALLIILGTSLKLPLSTTYVTFIVAMGTSLADRAWTRESAVFRITGVLGVIGGWFITAGVAFSVCALVTCLMFWGGKAVMMAFVVLAVFLLVRNNLTSSETKDKDERDELFQQLLRTTDKAERWQLLRSHVILSQRRMLERLAEQYAAITEGFITENLKGLNHASRQLRDIKERRRKIRQRELIGLRKLDARQAIQKNTWFHLGVNSAQQMMYCLRRMLDPALEHVDNNFNPLPERLADDLRTVARRVDGYAHEALDALTVQDAQQIDKLLFDIDRYTQQLSTLRKAQMDRMSVYAESDLRVETVYLNILQETQQLLSELRHFLRAYKNFII